MMTANEFIFDFGTLLQGTLFVFFIHLLSTYFFTKDKAFLSYSLFIAILLFNTISIIPTESSKLVYNINKALFDDTFWIAQLWFWMCLGWFLFEFLDIEKEFLSSIFWAKVYLSLNFILGTIFFTVDYFFFDAKYFFSYYHNLIHIPCGFLLIAYASNLVYKIKHFLSPFFISGLLIFCIACFQYFIFKLHPEYILFEYVDATLIFLTGIFIKIVIMNIGLSFKYQKYRIERDELDKKIVEQLNFNKELRTQSNNRLQKRLNKASKELERLAKEAQNLKLIQLQTKFDREVNSLRFSSLLSQMNPHFIFNSLNSIKLFIIQNKQRQAVFYLNKFSKFIRLVLDASLTQETNLFEEIEAMRLYTSIENVRFENEIRFDFTLEKRIDFKNIMVPPLVLHPFLENAIWHGVSSKKGSKKIVTQINEIDSHYIIKIVDNGIGRKKASEIELNKSIKRTSFGIHLTQGRLENFYKDYQQSFAIEITDVYDGKEINGTQVKLKIPKK